MPQHTYRFKLLAEVAKAGAPGVRYTVVDLDEDVIVEEFVNVTDDWMRAWACDRAAKTVQNKGLQPGEVTINLLEWSRTA